MARAICTGCEKEFHWTAKRGMKLASIGSPCCGAKARGKAVGKKRMAGVKTHLRTLQKIAALAETLPHGGCGCMLNLHVSEEGMDLLELLGADMHVTLYEDGTAIEGVDEFKVDGLTVRAQRGERPQTEEERTRYLTGSGGPGAVVPVPREE